MSMWFSVLSPPLVLGVVGGSVVVAMSSQQEKISITQEVDNECKCDEGEGRRGPEAIGCLVELHLRAGQINTKSLEGYNIECLDPDGSLQTCSSSNGNLNSYANNPGSESPAVTASPQVDRQKELNYRLLSAFKNKATVDNDKVQKLLEEGANPNATCDLDGDVYDGLNITPFEFMKRLGPLAKENWISLHVAASLNNLEAVRILLAADADPNICDVRGRTPLDVTGLVSRSLQSNSFTEVLKLLIDAGGRQNTMIEDHVRRCQTPLHTAVKLNNLDAVKLLLRHGAAAGCWNEDGDTPLHLCAKSEDPNNDIFKVLLAEKPDVVDSEGRTPLRAAIEHGWLEGALLALCSGVDVTLQAKDGETPLHITAIDKYGCFDERDHHDDNEIVRQEVLNDIISAADENKAIDCLNKKRATALYLAVKHGKNLIVKKLLEKGASIRHTVDSLNVFHVAAKKGHESVLKMLLDFDEDATILMVNSLTSNQGYGPIHFAVDGNHLTCVNVLKRYGANLYLHTGVNTGNWEIPYPIGTTPLHMAAANGNLNIAMSIIEFYDNIGYNRDITCISRPFAVQQRDGNGWCPIHSAISKNKKNIIKYLVLECNESLIEPTHSEKPETALDMIIQHVTNTTDFLKDILDSCISYNDQKKVEISYQVLIPNSCDVTLCCRSTKEEMDVIKQLLKTGHEFDQKSLLLHPIVQSFIFLKWQTMKPYYLLIASLYTVFLAFLLGYEVSAFSDKDISNSTSNSNSNTNSSILIVGGFIIYFLTLLIIAQELFMNYYGIQYLKNWRNWLKLGSLVPVLIVPPAMTASESTEWPRHVSSLTLFLVCFHMMNLLSQFPSWGYYVVMFQKVAYNVVKILATFSIMIVCFALSFKIEFRSEYPFNGLWDAFVKTIFMLSSEFEYNDVFDPKKAATLGSSFEVVRIILLAFLVLAAIVLMNMTVGVAVDDIHELKSHGKIGRLEKQAKFIRSLDRLNNSIWNSFLRKRRQFPAKIIFAGDVMTQTPDCGFNIKGLPKRITDDFCRIAQKNKEKKDSEAKKNLQLKAEKDKNNFFEVLVQKLDNIEATERILIMKLNRKARPRWILRRDRNWEQKNTRPRVDKFEKNEDCISMRLKRRAVRRR